MDELAAALGPAGDRCRRNRWRPRQRPNPFASSLAADADPAPAIPEPAIASPLPPAAGGRRGGGHRTGMRSCCSGDRRYRVRGWKKPLNLESLKVNLLVHRAKNEDERFHVDTLDLYSAKARAAFVKQAGVELGEAEDTLKHDLGRVLLKLEDLQDGEICSGARRRTTRPTLTDAEQAAALELLKAPELLDRILADFDRCGVVGEQTNKLVGYLAPSAASSTSRWPSSSRVVSAAGKIGADGGGAGVRAGGGAQVKYSAMTGQSCSTWATAT